MTVTRTSKNKDLLNPEKDSTVSTTKEKEEYVPNYDDYFVYSNVHNIEGLDADVQSNGISPELANTLLLKDIKKAEDAVKDLLRSAGLDTVPIEVFDALTSFQYFVGDASYIYYEGRKLSMLPWGRKRRWDRVADYIAADERDRQQRAKEAAIIYHLDYSTVSNEQQNIDRGFAKAIERSNKNPDYPEEKKAALYRAYYNHYGVPLVGSDRDQKLLLEDDKNEKKLKVRSGPWPY